MINLKITSNVLTSVYTTIPNFLFIIPLLWIAFTDLLLSSNSSQPPIIRFEIIEFYNVDDGIQDDYPVQKRYTYYFDNGLPWRYIIVDSLGNVQTDYFYFYNEEWHLDSARYHEDPSDPFETERFTYHADSTQKKTEWINQEGEVYYQMDEYFNNEGQLIKADFTGEQFHGTDSVFHNNLGLESQIFFTSVSGKRLNDRTFQYTKFKNDEWTTRLKMMGDSLNQVQVRTLSYGENSMTDSNQFYPGIISKNGFALNTISFSRDESQYFTTRGREWINQSGFLGLKAHGLYSSEVPVTHLDTIYNGALSPSGKKIIYCVREKDELTIWLTEKENGQWQTPVNLTKYSGVRGGYFSWASEEELYFYIKENEGDIVSATLKNHQLSPPVPLEKINTKAGVEFSPFIDREGRFLLFSRYDKSDSGRSGCYISYPMKQSGLSKWSLPEKIKNLPYGWGWSILYSSSSLIYTDGEKMIHHPFQMKDGRVIF